MHPLHLDCADPMGRTLYAARMQVEQGTHSTRNGAMFCRDMLIDEHFLPGNAHGDQQNIRMILFKLGENASISAGLK
ncbi:hypothetical protein AB664_27945 [Brucella anthropi]|uniref:Uncharacterized protein n=1 Tax=Brucella anthropi TaxID=529 RepID=A0A656Z736_BRUAN|nr:hypothetical protein AB664_27945 [Brucella anthropi]